MAVILFAPEFKCFSNFRCALHDASMFLLKRHFACHRKYNAGHRKYNAGIFYNVIPFLFIKSEVWCSFKLLPSYLQSEQNGNQLTLTCSNNNKTSTYTLSNVTSAQIQNLCSQLCRWCVCIWDLWNLGVGVLHLADVCIDTQDRISKKLLRFVYLWL